jgi:hypothetical protein
MKTLAWIALALAALPAAYGCSGGGGNLEPVETVSGSICKGNTDGGCALGGTDGSSPPPRASVLQFHNHANRDGFFVDAALTKARVATLHLDPTFNSATTRGSTYGSPLYVANGPGGKGTVYVATEENNVYAIDEATGGSLWSRSLGSPMIAQQLPCGNISPLGVTGTPAIDLATRTLVLDAVINTNLLDFVHMVFGLSIDDGTIKWSIDLATVKDPAGNPFVARYQSQRGAVLIVGNGAYLVFGGHFGDCGPYHGWVIGVPVNGNAANVRAFRTTAEKAGIWAPGGAASDGTSIFVTTGNAVPAASYAGSESVLRLGRDVGFTNTSRDFFAPANWQALDNADMDLASSGPLVIDAPAMKPSALVMAMGKDGHAYLLDRKNLGGLGGVPVGTTQLAGLTLTQAGAWANTPSGTFVIVRGNGAVTSCPPGTASSTSSNLIAVKLDPSVPSHMTVVWCAPASGTPIITTSDGKNDAMVWAASSSGLRSWDLLTGEPVLSSAPLPALVRPGSSPIVANGRVVLAAERRLLAFRPCRPGETDTCGNCGTRTCTSSLQWGPCQDEGVCTPRATTPTSCGSCGTRIDTCSNTCQWTPGTCAGGVCAPGATITVACGNCGTRVDTCSNSCEWTPGACTGEGVCRPGATQSCCPCGARGCGCGGEQACSSSCAWGPCDGFSCRPQICK